MAPCVLQEVVFGCSAVSGLDSDVRCSWETSKRWGGWGWEGLRWRQWDGETTGLEKGCEGGERAGS